MAVATHQSSLSISPESTPAPVPKPTSVKGLVESSVRVDSIPSTFSFNTRADDSAASESEDSIPVIDFSALTSDDPRVRSEAIRDLAKACEDWGFFMVVNHGVTERLMEAVLDGCDRFFNLPDEEKRQFKAKDFWDPLKFGSGVDIKVEKFFLWRDFLKCYTHPEFNFFEVPPGFRDVAREYCTKTREVARGILRGISQSLGLEETYIEKEMNFAAGLQIFAANFYPPCPQPELAIGLPPHTDPGLVTLLIQNGVAGLQVPAPYKDKWVNVDPVPGSIMVHTCDQLEVLTNGRYKSHPHRAVLNNTTRRISIAMGNGPSLDTVVAPAPAFVDGERRPAQFTPMKYKEFMELQQWVQLKEKTMLDHVRVQASQ
ncbi:2-oxoglutarate-dependent dioxygenase 19-like [Diospyros lotus]|uniref:2-oxoglutarate-dependent dioxygenase 19-like n=1 Tax=Diospyros lotus TaxID=55363 RepID=UPI002252A98A|nr:2-oxoglutarate-dependent dioxygenase 19-like [Diospyros lotus]